jgi:hypothetical protein
MVLAAEQDLRSPEVLAGILVADRPFGESRYIQDEVSAVYARRLSGLSKVLPAAGDLADALVCTDEMRRYRLLADPVMRGAIQHGLAQVTTGVLNGLSLADCADVFMRSVQLLGQTSWPELPDAANARRLGEGLLDCWIWSNESSEDVWSRSFRELTRYSFGEELCAPEAADLAMLRRAASLLHQVSPSLARSALSHVQGIALFPQSGRWCNASSCSQFLLGGVIFLAKERLQNPWYVAEHLLHEALHQKLYDIRHTHSVLNGDFAAQEHVSGIEVVSLWNNEDAPGSNVWAPARCLAAFHVYVHLAVFARLAARADEESAALEPGLDDVRLVTADSAFKRAVYLGSQLRHRCDEELGLAGQSLVDWLSQCLELTAEIPPESETRAALFLERYEREARRIESWVAGNRAVDGSLDARFDELSQATEREIASTRQVLSLQSEREALVAFDREIATCLSPGSSGRTLAELGRVRRAVLRCLEMAATGESSMEAAALAHRIVEAMVEASSDQLMRVLAAADGTGVAGYQGRDAKDRRADLLQLTDVIGEVFGTEDLGLLLFSLVRMHAPTVMVELGTGYGTSAFWMALAADINDHGHVWTVDDLSQVDGYSRLLAKKRSQLAGTVWENVSGTTGAECMEAIRNILGLDQRLTFVHRRMELADPSHFDGYEFPTPVDLLFSDFNHGPSAILDILGHFLPRMAAASSIFIDGASTSWPSYLLLEQLVEQLNRGMIPALLQDRCAKDLRIALEGRRIVLVHLTKTHKQSKNSTAWLKLEPNDLQPHPATAVRGLTERALG